MYAMVQIGSHCYKAEKDKQFLIDLVSKENGETLIFDKVIMISDNNKTEIGTPYLSASVKAEIVEREVKDKKLTIFKYKNKTNYHVKTGHRQKHTLIKILDIQK